MGGKGKKHENQPQREASLRAAFSQMSWDLCSATDSPLCPLAQVSSVSFRTSALPTPASMEGCVWPHTPRSSASAHPASRAMPANTISTSVSWTRDLAPRALPAITRWDLSGVSAPLGERIHTVTFSQDPAPLVAVPMGAPVSCFQEETLPSISASAPKVCPNPQPLSLSKEGTFPQLIS